MSLVASVSYEMGVMMFNVENQTPTGDYDLEGNFEGFLLYMKELLVKEKLYEGFVNQAENHGRESDAEKLFKKALDNWEISI